MKEIGQEIQQARQEKGIPLQEIASRTHIQLSHLQKIENGQFNFLPQPYVVAFIKTLAQYVGLNGEALVKRWHEQEPAAEATALPIPETPAVSKKIEQPRTVGAWAPAPNVKPDVALPISMPYLKALSIGFGMILFMTGLIYIISRSNSEKTLAARTHQNQNDAGKKTGAVQETPFKDVASYVAAKSQPVVPPPPAELSLQAQFENRTRLRVVRDGADTNLTVYSPGETQAWQAKEKFNLRVSVAGAVVLTLDGKNLGRFGLPDQIQYLTITRDGVIERKGIVPRQRTIAPRDTATVRPLEDLQPRRGTE
jgi:cytoskeletal protein RodZ